MRIGFLPIDMQDLLLQIALDSGKIRLRDERDAEKVLRTDLPVYQVPVDSFPEVNPSDPYDDRDFESYVETPISEYPPIIVAHGYFIDGNHRLYAARRQGVKSVAVVDASKLFTRAHVVKQRFLGKMRKGIQ